jgi:ATP-dependent exoDNAse (exonuclease V) alpha subunit
MEHGWKQGYDLLTSRDVLVIDEAGMVGTRQLKRVVAHAAEAGAKLVMVGDPQQLQAIEAGAAFRAIHERHGGVEITEVRRQREDWQRQPRAIWRRARWMVRSRPILAGIMSMRRKPARRRGSI